MSETGTKTATASKVEVARHEMLRAQDEFYLNMTAWSISGETNGTGRQCYKFALIYKNAIQHYLNCLDEEFPSWNVLRERQNATQCLSILSKDLEYLSKFRPTHSYNARRHASNRDSAAQYGGASSAE